MRKDADIIQFQKILLKRLVSRGTEAEQRAWNSFLSTIYGKSMVLQGDVAYLKDYLREFQEHRKVISMMEKDIIILADILMQESQELTDEIENMDTI